MKNFEKKILILKAVFYNLFIYDDRNIGKEY